MRGAAETAAVAAIVILCWIVGTATAQTGGISPEAAAERQLIQLIRADWQTARAKRCKDNRAWWRTPAEIPAGRTHAVRVWHQRQLRKLRQATPPRALCWRSHLWAAWKSTACVRRLESGNNPRARSQPSGTYRGLYQANRAFELAYGPKPLAWRARADRWPRWAQDLMGYRGWTARGFQPWPTTSRLCGLR